MEDLRIFHRENGHCNVPTDHRQFPKLGLWIKEQRRHFTLMKQGKSSHLTEERIAALNSVGFCYDTHETSFKERLKELATFKRESGHCNVPICFVKNKKLGTWVHHQRRQYKLHKEGQPCHITEERIRALEDIGIDWYPREKKRSSSGSGDGTASSDASSSGSDEEIDLDDYDFRPSKRQQLYNTDGDK